MEAAASLIYSTICVFPLEGVSAEAVAEETQHLKSEYVKVTIEEVYKGSNYSDTCISEFAIN